MEIGRCKVVFFGKDVLGRCSVGEDIGLELLSKLVRCVAILGCKALTSEAGCESAS